MKGKKPDLEFISQYISNCIENNISSEQDILSKAKADILKIDQEIKKVENLKKIRAKILDVILTFSKEKQDKSEEMINLSFYAIKNLSLAQSLCNRIDQGNNDIKSLTKSFKVNEVLLILKTLQQLNIITVYNNKYYKGTNFKQFLRFKWLV